jgi:hypothetical protein
VVVHDLHVVDVAVSPDEADPPLVVDADAVLAGSIALRVSKRLPGGTRRSEMFWALFNIRSFRRAAP